MSLQVTSREQGSQERNLDGNFMALADLAWEAIHCYFHYILLVTSESLGHLRFKGKQDVNATSQWKKN